MNAAIRMLVSLACDACGAPMSGEADRDQTLCARHRPPPSRRYYFTAQGTDGTYHATSGYAFGVTPFAALASACATLLRERPNGGTFQVCMSTNDNGPERPWETHYFAGVDAAIGTYREHVDTGKARR